MLIAFITAKAQPAHPFVPGEELHYRISYGWFPIGHATVKIDSALKMDSIRARHEGRRCYEVKTVARTTGILRLFAAINDIFTARVDCQTLKPVVASKTIREGKVNKVQHSTFDYETGLVKVRNNYLKKKKRATIKHFEIGKNDLDILSSYLYLRAVDWSDYQPSDSVMLKVFYDNKLYAFGVEYGGLETIHTIIGQVTAHRLLVLFPVSSTFPKEKAVVVWTTTDENQLPLRIAAEMKIGGVFCELVGYKNLKQSYAAED